jgi:hypothetical protein
MTPVPIVRLLDPERRGLKIDGCVGKRGVELDIVTDEDI